MRAILFSLASLIAVTNCIEVGLEDVYKKICAGHVDGGTTYYQPWEFMKGYQLGA